MINVIYSPNFLLSLILLIAILMFYSLRFVKPEASKEDDIFLTSLGLLYSYIILVHGWRLDPILFLSQILLVVIVLSLGWENIRLRGLLLKSFEKEEDEEDKYY